MRRLTVFLAAIDARAWRSLALSFMLFGGVGLVFLFGARWLGVEEVATARRWLVAVPGPWAPLAVAVAFAVLAFLGVPQFILIAAAVVAFGPGLGAVYSWMGTLVSALVGFGLGRAFGAGMIARLAGPGVDRFMGLIGANGFAASLIVRLVPFAPFAIVNMAAGVTTIRLVDFIAGTGLGIVPKIALTAFAGRSAMRVFGGGGARPLLALAIAAALWLGLGLLARRWLKRRSG